MVMAEVESTALFCLVYSAVFILPSSYRCLPQYSHRLTICSNVVTSSTTHSFFLRLILNSQPHVCIQHTRTLSVPILSDILSQELDGIGSFGLLSHAANYGYSVMRLTLIYDTLFPD